MTSLITKLTGAVALIGLGGLGGAVLAAPAESDRPPAIAQRPAPVEVRTEVIRRTIRIVKHEKPKRRPAPPAGSAAAAPPAPVVVTPAATRVVATASAPGPSARRVVTRSSSTGHGQPAHRVVTRSSATGHGGEHEHEGGGDD